MDTEIELSAEDKRKLTVRCWVFGVLTLMSTVGTMVLFSLVGGREEWYWGLCILLAGTATVALFILASNTRDKITGNTYDIYG